METRKKVKGGKKKGIKIKEKTRGKIKIQGKQEVKNWGSQKEGMLGVNIDEAWEAEKASVSEKDEEAQL